MGVGILGVGQFSEFKEHAKSNVGMGGNVGVDVGVDVDVEVAVVVGRAFQQNCEPLLHGSGGVGVGEAVGVPVG